MDVPGVDPFALATSGRQFVPTSATEQRLREQTALIDQAGAKGRQLLRDVQSYVAGIDAYYAEQNVGFRPWTLNDFHGPVLGYATVGGRRVAISSRRSTRGRELPSALAFQDLSTNRSTTSQASIAP
jgi:hypothetical protein